MTGRSGMREIELLEALRNGGAVVERTAPSRWALMLGNGVEEVGSAVLNDEWLELKLALGALAGGTAPGVSAGGAWEILRWNAGLAGLGRFALDGAGIDLRADIPLGELGEERTPIERVNQTCAELLRGLAIARGGGADPSKRGAMRGDTGECAPTDEVTECELPRLCAESGWEFTSRHGGMLAVTLDVPESFLQAHLEIRKGKGVLASVEIHNGEESDLLPVCRDALAVMLARTAAAVRMVRPVAVESEGGIVLRLEVAYGSPPSPTELSHALSALSVGCRLAGREARALRDERLAAGYLSVSMA